MKYYKITTKNYYGDRIASYVDFDNNAEEDVFKRIGNGEIISSESVFEYFYLSSYDKEVFWEWNLFDVHKFYGKAGWLTPNLLISEKLKTVLNKFTIAEPHCYYHSKLLYRNKKLNYYVFQFTGIKIIKYTLLCIDFINSVFIDPVKQENIKIDTPDKFLSEYKRIRKANGIDDKLKIKKLVIKNFLDFIPVGTLMDDNIVSERLRQAIEQNGVTGFEFSELNYEVAVALDS